MGHHSVTGRSYNGSHPHKCHGMYIAVMLSRHITVFIVSAGSGQPGALTVRSVPAGLVTPGHHWQEGGQGCCGLGIRGPRELGIRGAQTQLQHHHHHSEALQLRGAHHHLRPFIRRPGAEEGWVP